MDPWAAGRHTSEGANAANGTACCRRRGHRPWTARRFVCVIHSDGLQKTAGDLPGPGTGRCDVFDRTQQIGRMVGEPVEAHGRPELRMNDTILPGAVDSLHIQGVFAWPRP